LTKGGDTLNAISIPTLAGAGHGAGKQTVASNAIGSDSTFKSQLDGSIVSRASAKSNAASTTTTTASTATTATTSLDADLQAQIERLLDAGTSASDVVTKLANSMASSLASALGISTAAAKAKLTQAFSAAMSAANTGPPLTNAERASALVTRFRQLAGLVTRVTNGDQGQPIRMIAGQSSDAEQAGATPAPTPDSILRDALAALAAPASSAVTAQAAATSTTSTSTASSTGPVPVSSRPAPPNAQPVAADPVVASSVVATGGTSADPKSGGWDARAVPTPPTTIAATLGAQSAQDQRTVAVDPVTLVATGGDTTIGRILARATLAASATTATQTTTTETATDAVAATAPAAAATATDAGNADASTATTAAAVKTVDAFTQAFSAALARADAMPATKDTGPAAVAADSSASSSIASLEAAGGLVTGAGRDATAVAPPTLASTLPQAQNVDANAVVEQVLQGVSLQTADGSSTVRLRLVPETLGDVSIKLVVSGGSVDATVTASTPAAQSALQGGQAQLARTLADSGLKLQSFTVGLGTGSGSTSGNGTGSDAQSRSRNGSAHRVGAIGATDEGDAETDESSLLAAPQIGPPIYTASTALGALNYLA
jgi:flagellar hook-length control protein FliK